MVEDNEDADHDSQKYWEISSFHGMDISIKEFSILFDVQ
jgi:hypothetical protein